MRDRRVVVADAALYERHASKSELRRVLAGCGRWPGTSRARRVIDFADGLAESVLESCARVLFRDHGLPPPELQVHITGRDRTMIARVDFFWRRYGVVAETDGLLKYDSGLGRLREDVHVTDDGIAVGGKTIKALAERDPGALPWGELGVDVVLESTGFFTTAKDARKHVDEGGAQRDHHAHG